LARYIDSVVRLIDSDPRFRNLREYRELLYEYLGALPKDYSRDLYELKPKEYSFRREDTVYTIPMEEPFNRDTMYGRDIDRDSVAVEKNIPVYRRTTIGRGGGSRNIKRIIIIVMAILIVCLIIYAFLHIHQYLYSPKQYMDLGPITISVNRTSLVFEIRKQGISRNDLVFEVSSTDSSSSIFLNALGVLGRDYVVARYAYVNKTYAKLIFSLSDIENSLRRHNISSIVKIKIPQVGTPSTSTFGKLRYISSGKICYIKLQDTPGLMRCETANFVLFSSEPVEQGYATIYDVVLDKFNDVTMDFLRRTIYGDSPPSDIRWAVWRALDWVDKNIAYDDEKASTGGIGIYDPITTIRLGRGVCSDYAVLTSAILLSADINPVYILTFNTSIGSHTVAGIELNNTLWILDQHLPVIEWDDYRQYVANITSQVYVYKIWYSHGAPSIEFYRMDKEYLDTYPIDTIDSNIAIELNNIVSRTLGLKPSARPLTLGTCIYIYRALPSLGKPHTSLDTAYSPIFKEQWVSWLATDIATTMRNTYPELTNKQYLYISISRTETYTTIQICST